jgi:hypothetical protein
MFSCPAASIIQIQSLHTPLLHGTADEQQSASDWHVPG